jgi:hypothetical protein
VVAVRGAHRPCPLPRAAGVYAWYFRQPPKIIPLENCLRRNELVLLYVEVANVVDPQYSVACQIEKRYLPQ